MKNLIIIILIFEKINNFDYFGESLESYIKYQIEINEFYKNEFTLNSYLKNFHDKNHYLLDPCFNFPSLKIC